MDLDTIIQQIMSNQAKGVLPTQNPALAPLPSNPGALDAAVLSRFQGANPQKRFEAQYTSNILGRNYEGGRNAVSRQIGPGMVNELTPRLPQANPQQLKQIAAILSSAGNQDDALAALMQSGGPR